MTDAELHALERAAHEATPGPWTHGEDAAFWLGDEENRHYVAVASPDKVLSLIGAVRQAQAERDWVIKNIRNADAGPTACPSRDLWEACDEALKYHRDRSICRECWTEAVKEAVCKQ